MKVLKFVIPGDIRTLTSKILLHKQLTMRQFCTLFIAFGFIFPVFSQNNYWKPVKPESINLPAVAERKIQPLKSNSFELDYAGLKAALSQAPMEFTPEAKQQPLTMSLPLADGSLLDFHIWESPVMAPELMAKFPEIRTYAGSAADGSGLIVRLGVGHKGFHAFIFSPDGGVQSVRPYSEDAGSGYYMNYRMEDLPNDPSLPGRQFICGADEHSSLPLSSVAAPGNKTSVVDRNAVVTLRKYRFAVAAQGEYSVFHGGTKPLVLSAIVEGVNFIAAIQERDWAVRLELIANNDEIIFLDPATDPYSGDLVTSWMNQNPAAINPIIGTGSYDIGHVFCRVTNTPGGVYVAGLAELASVCTLLAKARGGSSLPSPTGEDFYLIAAHEIGHQFSATHTFNSCPPSADNVSSSTAYEPGGGSTIMSYAGTCAPDIVENSQQSYYHIASIEQVVNFLTQGGGNTCGEAIVTDNTPPELSIPLTDGFYIPISTAFKLDADATDPDGDNLTYCWEEFDLGPSGPLGQPTLTAPAFRSFEPTDESARTFPRLTSIVFNQQNDTEVLPTYSREFNFKCTVRDNHPGSGGVASDAVKFYATDQAGPFLITYPNTNSVVWNIGEYQTITWNVANTDKSPVNCKTVNIWLSLNNGLVNQVLLASGVPNTGKCCIQVPDNLTNTARIRVEAADNVFFDISNAGFKIQAATQADFSICPAVFGTLACTPAVYTTEISTGAVLGFNASITLEATGLPPGATATFSPNPVAPGSSSTLTVDFSDGTAEGAFDLTVSATANGNTKTSVIAYNVVQNDFSGLALQTPVDGAQSVDIGPWLSWNGVIDADQYEIQVATSPSFEAGTILAAKSDVTLDSFKVPILLAEGQVCYWRVRPKNTCGNGAWTAPFVFVTKVQNCTSLASTDLPVNISSNGTPTVTSKITVSGPGALLSDVNVKKVQGNHAFLSDLDVQLISPAGTGVSLFKNKCPGYSGNFNIGFDDSAISAFACPPPQNGAYAKPAQPLSALAGQNSGGIWTLQVKDNSIGSGGQISGFELEFCSSIALNAPFIVNNNTLQVMPGANAAVSDNLLKVDDANNGADQLIFTIVTVPVYGDLRIAGIPLQPGAQFTQADINNGLLRYYEYGFNTGTDDFRFSVTDGEGGLVAGTFNIQPFPLGTGEPGGNIAFDLAPNPAGESVRLFVSQPLDSDSHVRLFNIAGQLLHSWTLPSGATMLLLDVADLPDGIYAVAVENAKGSGVRKVVVR